jgi:uroporphyrinogen-III decarboxylase
MTQIARTIKQRHPDTPIIVFPKGAHYALDDLKAAGVFDVIGKFHNFEHGQRLLNLVTVHFFVSCHTHLSISHTFIGYL